MFTVAPASVVPRRVYEVMESSTSATAFGGWVTAIVGGLAKRRSWTPRYAPKTRTPTVISARTTMNGENVRPLRGAARGRGAIGTGADSRRRTSLASPLVEDLVRVEAEVERVVAQEALRVDVARQLLVVATLERAQVARPDLRVALGPVQVDALGFAGRVQALGEAERRVGRAALVGRPVVEPGARTGVGAGGPSRPVSCRHRSSPSGSTTSSSIPGAASRRSTGRAFEPSNAPMYPRASSWSIMRAARA